MLNFLLRRGQFHAGTAARVRASRSISCHDRTGREFFKVDRGIDVAVVMLHVKHIVPQHTCVANNVQVTLYFVSKGQNML